MLRRIRLWLGSFAQRRAEADLADEIRFHIEQQTEHYVRQGLSREHAYRRARIDFGGVESAKEEYRERSGARGFFDAFGDVRYALRTL